MTASHSTLTCIGLAEHLRHGISTVEDKDMNSWTIHLTHRMNDLNMGKLDGLYLNSLE